MTNSTQFSALICATLGAFFIVSCAAEKPAHDPIQNLKATEVSEALKKDDTIVVLDIRTPAEYAEGHLAGAKNIDFKAEDFEAKIGELDSGKAYVVHCKSGGRSSLSMQKFSAKGFTHILHMDDGYLGWTEAKLPVEK